MSVYKRYRAASPQAVRTSSMIWRHLLSESLIFVPTEMKSDKRGLPVPLTEVACSPLYPSAHRVRSYFSLFLIFRVRSFVATFASDHVKLFHRVKLGSTTNIIIQI